MTQLTKLQRNLYNELLKHTDARAFDNAYSALMQGLTPAQRKYYPRESVFVQGQVKGSPAHYTVKPSLKELIIKAGYKDTESDRTYKSYFKVLEQLYKLV